MQGRFEKEELQAPLAEINMTPMIDIMLVLMIIFLITAPLITSSIKLNLPKESASSLEENDPLTISINQKGEFFLEEKSISSEQLKIHLSSISKENPKQAIHLRADVEVSYGKVSYLLATLQNLGLTNVGFITEN